MKTTETKEKKERTQTSARRKFAEWVSLVVSAALITALGGFLAYEGLKGNSPLVPVKIQPLLEGLSVQDGRFVLPVRVANNGRQTLHELALELEEKQAQGPAKTTEMLVSYLGAGSERIVYFYFDEKPEAERIKLRPLGYQVD